MVGIMAGDQILASGIDGIRNGVVAVVVALFIRFKGGSQIEVICRKRVQGFAIGRFIDRR